MLTGRVVVDDRCRSRGIGPGHAIVLASHGARVVVNDAGVEADGSGPSTAPADDVVAEVRRAGGEAVASHDDVVSGARTIVVTALAAFGRLDAVFEVGAGAVNLLEGWRRAAAIRHDAGSPALLGEMVLEGLSRLADPVPVMVPVTAPVSEATP